jgi:hypothetical protein
MTYTIEIRDEAGLLVDETTVDLTLSTDAEIGAEIRRLIRASEDGR